MAKKMFFNNSWTSIELLGKGSYGSVYKAKKVDEEIYSAIKQIEIPNNNEIIKELKTEGLSYKDIELEFETLANNIVKEIEIMDKLKKCDNIVQILDYELYEVETPTKEISKKYVINIRMELLKDINKKIIEDKFTTDEAIKLGIDISKALYECEKNNIIHRDVKIENIFIDNDGNYKLGDFGEAKNIEKNYSSMTRRGTENYMAPEIYKGENGNKTIDIYSLGMVLYRLFNNRKIPFMNPDKTNVNFEEREEALKRRITGEEILKPINATKEIWSVIKKCLEYNPDNRYQSSKDVLNDLLDIKENNKKNIVLFKDIEDEEEKDEETEKITSIIRVIELSKDELSNGCTKTIEIDGKSVEVTIPKDSEEKDEIIIESAILEKHGIKKKIRVIVILSLLLIPVFVDSNGGASADNINSNKDRSSKKNSNNSDSSNTDNTKNNNRNNSDKGNKNNNNSNNGNSNPKKGKSFKKTGITLGSITTAIIVAILIIINKPTKDTKNEEPKEVKKEETKEEVVIKSKKLSCNLEEKLGKGGEVFNYVFKFNKDDELEKINLHFYNDIFPQYEANMDSELKSNAKRFCKEKPVVKENCEYKVKKSTLEMNLELKPKYYLERLEGLGFKKKDNETLIDAMKKYFESPDLNNNYYEYFSISTQAGNDFKVKCKIEEK